MINSIEDLKKYLSSKITEFEIIEHNKTIKSSKQGAEYFNIEIGQTAPTLIVSSENTLYGVIFSGERKQISLEKIANLLNCSETRLATKEEIKNQLGYDIGCVPMVGLPIECIVDGKLMEHDCVYGGTGLINSTLKMNPIYIQDTNKVISVTYEL